MIRIARMEDAPKFAEIYRPYVEKSAVSFETEAQMQQNSVAG